MPTQVRGEWVVGLNPDDRMPHDWLRMVARVFAAFRKAPLKDSIVVYIDGFKLTLVSHLNFRVRVKIEPGQAFVDDQFIGFIEDSYLDFTTTSLAENIKYCIVLHYRWLNQFPPPEPTFELHPEINVNHEEMLSLGYVTCTRDPNTGECHLELVDEKLPWYKEWIAAATGNTEVNPESELPYIIAVKGPSDGEFPDDPIHPENEMGSLDIGWALDFHHEVGNGVNYNTRLHTDKVQDGVLFVNNRRIISEIDPSDANNPYDPNDPGDKYIPIRNNLIIFDEKDGLYPIDNIGSDSGKISFTLAARRINTSPIEPEGYGAASLTFDLDSTSSSWTNRSDFEDQSTTINNLSLTDQTDVVTINGHPIWHGGNLVSSGESIIFLGHHSGPPTERPNGDPLVDGDTYYDTDIHAFFYYQVDNWIQVGRSDAMKQYEIIASEGQTNVSCEYNPDFIWIGVSGVQLSRKDYIASDGQTITFNTPLRQDETISIFSMLSGEAFGVRLKELSDVQIVNIAHGETIVWDNVLMKWRNYRVSVSELGDIGNVDTTNISEGDVIKWSSALNKWITSSDLQDMQLSALRDVQLTNPASGETLINNGQYWVNGHVILAGTIIMWAGGTPPEGFLVCDGSEISRNDYSNLFNKIGEDYGSGDGVTTFNLPDLSQAVPTASNASQNVTLNYLICYN
jgi:hypothetical protein